MKWPTGLPAALSDYVARLPSIGDLHRSDELDGIRILAPSRIKPETISMTRQWRADSGSGIVFPKPFPTRDIFSPKGYPVLYSGTLAMKNPIEDRRQAIRLQILRSAATAFKRLGYHATNMNQIADAVGMTKSNLYNYFRAKEEILYFCHEYGMSRLLRLLDSTEKGSYPPEVKLRRLMASFVHLMVDEFDGEILSLEFKELTGSRLRRILASRDKLDRGMRRIISRGVNSGAFREVDPKLSAFTIWGAMNWIPRWFSPRGPAGSVEISDVMIDCLFNGIINRGDRSRTRKR